MQIYRTPIPETNDKSALVRKCDIPGWVPVRSSGRAAMTAFSAKRSLPLFGYAEVADILLVVHPLLSSLDGTSAFLSAAVVCSERTSQWWTLLPIDARVKKGRVSGAELRAYLEGELELVFSKDPWKLSGGWGRARRVSTMIACGSKKTLPFTAIGLSARRGR